ncbi:Uncharacterized protein L728 [Zea mays]|uniref:Uncharacterized protein L728 n=1 Tax=Zea mays TaxID=4577 RepID=A0A3L6DYJ7_MAIZE|nr:Uncharacterized protein L728 [Zea mays]
MKNYMDLFLKHDVDRFNAYLVDVKSGNKRIAAGALLPHEIVAPHLDGFNSRETLVQLLVLLRKSAWAEMKDLVREAKAVVKISSFKIIVAQGVTGSFPWSALAFAPMWLELMGFTHNRTGLLMITLAFAPMCLELMGFTHNRTGLLMMTFALASSLGGLLGGKMGDHFATCFSNSGRIVLSQISSASAIPLAALLLLGLPDNSSGSLHGLVMFIMGLSISWNGPATNKQWQRMVDDMRALGKLSNCVAVCDVSGSMYGRPMEVCVALGLLVSELSNDPWRGHVVTFSRRPELHRITDETLSEKTRFIQSMDWGTDIDFQAVFNKILKLSVGARLAPERMGSHPYSPYPMQTGQFKLHHVYAICLLKADKIFFLIGLCCETSGVGGTATDKSKKNKRKAPLKRSKGSLGSLDVVAVKNNKSPAKPSTSSSNEGSSQSICSMQIECVRGAIWNTLQLVLSVYVGSRVKDNSEQGQGNVAALQDLMNNWQNEQPSWKGFN